MMKSVLGVLLCSVAAFAQTGEAASGAMEILFKRCLGCHGRKVQMSGLDLSARDGALRGGTAGPALVPGKPDDSVLLQKVRAGGKLAP